MSKTIKSNQKQNSKEFWLYFHQLTKLSQKELLKEEKTKKWNDFFSTESRILLYFFEVKRRAK